MSEILPLKIQGPAGALEGRLSLPAQGGSAMHASAAPGVAVLCHPHPQYGGSMHDGVLSVLEQALLSAGWTSLRFNFRGVGASDGQFDQGKGESLDVLAVLEALGGQEDIRAALSADQRAAAPLLCGYSFGAAMAWQAQLQTPMSLAALWLVAPPLSMLPFDAGDPDCPLDILLGDQDAFCETATAQQWLAQSPVSGALHTITGGDHFFSGQQQALRGRADALLDSLASC